MSHSSDSEAFGGTIRRSYVDSTPWWPPVDQAPAGSPNVLIILLDDAGFANFGCFGGTVATPNIDRLARGGLRYTNFTTTSLCSPSRAALLGGRNHHSMGFGCLPELEAGYPGYYGRLRKDTALLPRLLRDGAYNTFHLGKWHLTRWDELSPAGPFDCWPRGVGFQRSYGFLTAETSQWEPVLVSDNHYVDRPSRADYHLTQDITDKAIEMIGAQKSAAPDKPFFCYFATGAMHAPHHAPREYIERYAGQFDQGWDAARAEILQRQIELGIVPDGTKLAPRAEGVPAWDDLDTDARRVFSRMMEVFGGYLEHTDAQIGRVVTFLEDIGQLDNTLVIVTSDNGASAEGGLEGSVNELRMANGVPEDMRLNLRHLDDLGGPNLYNHYPVGWAQVSNTPHKWFKQTAHYGGVRDALIMHWSQGISARGEIRRQYFHIIDLMPTVLEVAKIVAPNDVDGVPQKPIEGVSMVSSFNDAAAASPHTTQYFEMLGNRGVYHDGWKAVTFHGRMPWLHEVTLGAGDFDNDVWELYHVDSNVSECVDLAAEHPDTLATLKDLFDTEAERYHVFPLDDRITVRALTTMRPNLFGDRDTWTLYPGLVQLNLPTAPLLEHTSHRITANILHGGTECHGVLAAWGGRKGGWALVLDHGYPVYVHNYLGEHTTNLRSAERLPDGASAVSVQWTERDQDRPYVELSINDAAVGRSDIAHAAPLMNSLMEGLCIGRDLGSPVCDLYQIPGAFTGELRSVVIERKGNDKPHRAVAAAEAKIQ